MLADYLSALAPTHIERGELDKAMEAAEEGLRVAESINNAWAQSANLFPQSLIFIERGESGKGLETTERGIALSEQGGFTGAAYLVYSVIGLIYGEMGAFDQGLQMARRALTGTDEIAWSRQYGLAVLGYLHLMRAETKEAYAAIEEAFDESDSEDSETNLGFTGLYLAAHVKIRGEFDLHAQKYDRLLAHAEHMIALMNQRDVRICLPDALRLKGEALMGLGRSEEGRQSLVDALAEAEAQGSRRALWPILSALIQVEEQRGDEDAASKLRKQAREVMEYIAEHAGSPELRDSFLSQPRIRAVLGS